MGADDSRCGAMGACGGSKDQKQAKSPRNESDPSAAGGGSQEHKPEPKMCSVMSEKLALGVMTNFNDAEIEALKKRFDEVAKLVEDNGVITKDEFQQALCQVTKTKEQDSPMIFKLLFDNFDTGNTGNINFQDFVTGLSVFSKGASVDEKIKFSFKLFDLKGDDRITKQEIFQVVEGSCSAKRLSLTEDQIRQLVDKTLKAVQGSEDGLTFEQYEALCKASPDTMLTMFTLEGIDLEPKVPYAGQDIQTRRRANSTNSTAPNSPANSPK